MGNNSKKGDRRERELVNRLDADGFAVMRAPASGGGTDRELPDVLCGNGEDFYAIEGKSSEKEVIYIKGYEVEDLIYFAQSFGAKARIGVRFDLEHGDPAYGDDDEPGWYFFHPDELYQTDGGNYRVKKEKAIAEGVPYSDFVSSTTQARLTDASS